VNAFALPLFWLTVAAVALFYTVVPAAVRDRWKRTAWAWFVVLFVVALILEYARIATQG
jgi:hypothetical protein